MHYGNVPRTVQGQHFGGLGTRLLSLAALITPEMASINFSEPMLILLGNCITMSRFASSAE